MNATFLTSALIAFHITAFSQSQGPFTAGSISNYPIAGSSSSWLNVDNARISDNQYSNFNNLPDKVGDYTDFLVATGFNFNIPSATTITGIVVEVECSDPNQVSTDHKVHLYLDGPAGVDHSIKTPYEANDQIITYGSSSDLWGEALDYGKVNDPNFGIAISVQRDVNGVATLTQIDDIRVTVYYSFIILPVRLISFNATRNVNFVDLDWSTADETGMNRFELERSDDGSYFQNIGNVNARNYSSNFYTARDNFPLQSRSFYRLKMIGTAGDHSYSAVVAIDLVKHHGIQIYPNPVVNGEKLRIDNPMREKIELSFYDLSGKLVFNQVMSEQEIILPPGKLKGEFVYRITNSTLVTIATGRLLIK